MRGKITTHVLDTARGRPGAGMELELSVLHGKDWKPLKTVTTDQDGRTGQPLLEGDELKPGTYQLLFHVGDYFGEKAFLDLVPIRFGIADASAHCHVPLLCTPWGYTTYRGS